MDLVAVPRGGGGLRIGGGVCWPGPWILLALRERVKKFVVDSVPVLARATFKLATGKWNGPLFPQEGLAALREQGI